MESVSASERERGATNERERERERAPEPGAEPQPVPAVVPEAVREAAPGHGFGAASYGRAALVLALIGATVGPCLDALHTFSAATWYAQPQLLRSVWWCPPLFAFAAVSIGLPRAIIDRRLDGAPLLRVTRGAVAYKMALFFLGYALSGFLPAPWWVKALVLVALFVAALWPHDTRGVFLGALGAALGGWLVEWQLTSHQLFFHRDTQLWGVAGWIPALYALAAVAVGALGRYMLGPRD
jgi:hypothetical protein